MLTRERRSLVPPPALPDFGRTGRKGAGRPDLPAPAALPSLTSALSRRAALFGPLEVDAVHPGVVGLMTPLPDQIADDVMCADVARHEDDLVHLPRRGTAAPDHTGVLREHHPRGEIRLPSLGRSLVGGVVSHLRLLGRSRLA